jgi:hypothetical protein
MWTPIVILAVSVITGVDVWGKIIDRLHGKKDNGE